MKERKNNPDKIGFVDSGRNATFGQFQEEALALASEICHYSCFKRPVAVFTEKSIDALVAFMAVAYSGNFYSPIDMDMPEPRIRKILDILQPDLIITKAKLKERIQEIAPKIECICMDCMDSKIDMNLINGNRNRCCDTDLLYVLFTSGSTGEPKGVTICHQSVMDYIDWVEETFQMNSTTVFGNQAPFYFDNSILDIYTTMKTGATLYLIPQELFAWPVRLLQYIRENDINTIFWVPSAMILVSKLKALKRVDLKNKLTKILFAGEVMPNKHLNIWRKYLPEALYANLYGPTEITDVCSCYIVDREFGDEEPLPIGKAIHNTDVLVLNDKDELVGVGETGELCVRGTSLSKGYYNNLEKTKEVFVQNPLNHNYVELIYRTGDLVKYNEYGEIMYVTRKDFQIKHMGHRIELGEIETAVSSIGEIAWNCCLYDEDKNKIVLFIDQELDASYIKDKLRMLLPEYMIPNKVIYIENMPLNANGKIDRKALEKMNVKKPNFELNKDLLQR